MDNIVSKAKRRVSLLKDALRLVAEILSMIPERREVIKSRPNLRHKEGYFDNGMIQRGTEKVFLMGPPLVDGPRYTALTQCLADRLSQCELEFHDTYNLPSEMIGEARLIKEPVWRACMEGLKMTLTWELTEAEAAITIEHPPVPPESPGDRSSEREDPPMAAESPDDKPAEREDPPAAPEAQGDTSAETEGPSVAVAAEDDRSAQSAELPAEAQGDTSAEAQGDTSAETEHLPVREETQHLLCALPEIPQSEKMLGTAEMSAAGQPAKELVVHTFAEWRRLLSWTPTTWARRRKDFAECFKDVPGENACSIREPELSQWMASAQNRKRRPFGNHDSP